MAALPGMKSSPMEVKEGEETVDDSIKLEEAERVAELERIVRKRRSYVICRFGRKRAGFERC